MQIQIQKQIQIFICLRGALALSMSASICDTHFSNSCKISCNICFTSEIYPGKYAPATYVSLGITLLKCILQYILQHMFHWELHFWNISWKIYPCNICFTGNYTSEIYPGKYIPGKMPISCAANSYFTFMSWSTLSQNPWFFSIIWDKETLSKVVHHLRQKILIVYQMLSVQITYFYDQKSEL